MGPIIVGKRLTDPDVIKSRRVNYTEIPIRTDHRTMVVARGVEDIPRVCKKYNINEQTKKELSEKYNINL